MSNTVTIELEFPVTLKMKNGRTERDEIIDTVELRRPKVKDIKGLNLEQLEGDDLEVLVRRLSGLDRAVMAEIDVTDFLKLAEVIGGFFPRPSTDANN